MHSLNMGNNNSRNNYFNGHYEDPSLVIEPYVYLGGASINQNPKLANSYGITHILNMASDQAPNMHLFGNPNIKYKHIPADDVLNYNIRYHFEEAFEIIDDARRTNGRILVHCTMGISRSATIVIAYLMSRYNMSLRSAYDYVRSKRSIVAPNSLFLKLLQDYENELRTSVQREYIERKRQFPAKKQNLQNGFMNNISINSSGNFKRPVKSYAFI
ncbi:dual specificity phosphatase 1 [Brachionus plicatilis]|uniref:protein-tyrosine-phosphatase n=1 Tax=Brachionus plicatilis TaxID=10195 RepID=A0A3M7PXB6_BRAPC|nr:dual specificity phosphatase 1 [Brachionus plicatilis]